MPTKELRALLGVDGATDTPAAAADGVGDVQQRTRRFRLPVSPPNIKSDDGTAARARLKPELKVGLEASRCAWPAALLWPEPTSQRIAQHINTQTIVAKGYMRLRVTPELTVTCDLPY
jgi:hypothetical protein